ncbi:MAG: DNA translocase FtsK 4TM domain-containing protein, partial [Deltaproteobacteria bacterium]|nr:DNA translocase FtsK 4TM domain-containing protein [Deltaproteobacteria bacterium]
MPPKAKQIKPKGEPSPVRREIASLFYLAIGLFFYLSLFSYHSSDPSFLNVTGSPIRNWGGVIGSYLADSLLFLFGGGAYFIGFFFLLAFVLVFSGAKKRVHWMETCLYFVFIVCIAVLFQMGKGHLHYGKETIPAGGFLGSLLGNTGVNYLGRAGAYLIVLVGALLTFVWATRLTLRDLGKGSFKILAPFGAWLAGQGFIYLARAKKSALVWWEERRARRAVPVKELKIKLPQAVLPLQTAAEVLPGGPKILERIDRKKTKSSPQLEFQHISGDYKLPPLNLLDCDAKGEEVPV